MKNVILLTMSLLVLVMAFPQTTEAGWHVSWYDDCDCGWGVPDPWDPWWECPCYWEIWVWCSWHPYWMWPWWCRQWVDYHYSSCGRYYYVYYDYYVPGCTRMYVDGRYRYRYSVEMDRSYTITERIPRRTGMERPGYEGAGPVPESAYRELQSLGPDYRVKTAAAHASPVTRTQSNRPDNSTVSPSSYRERPQVESGSSGSSYRTMEQPSMGSTRNLSAPIPVTPNMRGESRSYPSLRSSSKGMHVPPSYSPDEPERGSTDSRTIKSSSTSISSERSTNANKYEKRESSSKTETSNSSVGSSRNRSVSTSSSSRSSSSTSRRRR